MFLREDQEAFSDLFKLNLHHNISGKTWRSSTCATFLVSLRALSVCSALQTWKISDVGAQWWLLYPQLLYCCEYFASTVNLGGEVFDWSLQLSHFNHNIWARATVCFDLTSVSLLPLNSESHLWWYCNLTKHGFLIAKTAICILYIWYCLIKDSFMFVFGQCDCCLQWTPATVRQAAPPWWQQPAVASSPSWSSCSSWVQTSTRRHQMDGNTNCCLVAPHCWTDSSTLQRKLHFNIWVILCHFRTALDFAQYFQQMQAVELLHSFMSVSLSSKHTMKVSVWKTKLIVSECVILHYLVNDCKKHLFYTELFFGDALAVVVLALEPDILLPAAIFTPIPTHGFRDLPLPRPFPTKLQLTLAETFPPSRCRIVQRHTHQQWFGSSKRKGHRLAECRSEQEKLLNLDNLGCDDQRVNLDLVIDLLHIICCTTPEGEAHSTASSSLKTLLFIRMKKSEMLFFFCYLEGATLIFLPGYDEIVKVKERIQYDDQRFSPHSQK